MSDRHDIQDDITRRRWFIRGFLRDMEGTHALERYLARGWEPFAVDGGVTYLRKFGLTDE